MRKLTVLSTLVFGAVASPAFAVVYSTDFSSIASPSGGTLQGDNSIFGVGSFSTGTPAAIWSASVGNFDYLKDGNSGYRCAGNSGHCIELGGSTGFGAGGNTPPSTVSFSLNLAPGSYAISFDYNRQLHGPSGFDFTIGGGPATMFTVSGPLDQWLTHTQLFTATGPVTFSFITSALNQNVGSLIDNVTVVPEPGQWALMLAGLGVVGLVAKRRQAK